jgi:hypothetical protein
MESKNLRLTLTLGSGVKRMEKGRPQKKLNGQRKYGGTALKNEEQSPLYIMAPTTAQKAAAARARANRHPQSKPSITPEITVENIAENLCLPSPIDVDDGCEDFDDCGYVGGVNVSLSDSESDYELSEDEWTESESESLAELEGDELEDNLQSLREEVQQLSVPSPYAEILKTKTTREWAAAESNRGLGYNGLSDRTGRRNAQKAREREEEQKNTRKS